MREREVELADKLELHGCGEHVHVALFDVDGQCFGDAALTPRQARELAARIQAMLYEMHAMEDQ